MDPLPTLRALATDVDNGELDIFDGKPQLANTSGLDTSTEHVLLIWSKVWAGKSAGVIEIATKQVSIDLKSIHDNPTREITSELKEEILWRTKGPLLRLVR